MAERNDPCTATVTPGENGGITVTLTVPCYGEDATFELKAERRVEGDWIVFIPWPAKVDTAHGSATPDGAFLLPAAGGGFYEGVNGTLVLGAPE